jgi:hypothetical protein
MKQIVRQLVVKIPDSLLCNLLHNSIGFYAIKESQMGGFKTVKNALNHPILAKAGG